MADGRGRRAAGGIVARVEPGSVGGAAGLQPGDRLLSINGQPLRDVIDVRFYASEEMLDLQAEREGVPIRARIKRQAGQPVGLEFTQPTFDTDIRRCTNRCEFCFVAMNAPGMRPSLYIKDDDYRYSFLFGSFVTLTNLTGDDWARLEEQRLSPLYVSVHATESELRRRFLGRERAPDILEQLRRLASLGIEVHAQVVLVPGLNDGQHLDRTLCDLAPLYRQPLLSISLVPVGLTQYHRGSCRPYTPGESRAVLDQVAAWRDRSRKVLGSTFVYPSDEWYLVAGRDMPPAPEYDGFPQAENGVGLVRQLLDEWEQLERVGYGVQAAGRSATLACGTLIAPVLGGIVDAWNAHGARLRLVSVLNRFFGPVTTVSGLLTGRDVITALQAMPLGDLVLLPRAMFTGRYGAGDAPPGVTLDDMSLADISAQLGVPAEMAGTLGEVVAVMR